MQLICVNMQDISITSTCNSFYVNMQVKDIDILYEAINNTQVMFMYSRRTLA